MLKTKKVPLRMCAGCSQRKPKKELVRIVRSPEGDISLDATGKKSGRGVYVCPDPQCLKMARKTRKPERSLECQIPPEIYDRLEAELGGG